MKHEQVWIVVADGAHANVFQHAAEGPGLELVPDVSFAVDLPPTRDLLSDRPGRTFESTGPSRHAKTARTDPHRELKRALARRLASALDTSLAAERYDRLILVAPPVTLGDLRSAMSETVQAHITAEIGQDLVKMPLAELSCRLVKLTGGNGLHWRGR